MIQSIDDIDITTRLDDDTIRAVFDWLRSSAGLASANEAGFEAVLPHLLIQVPKASGEAPYLWCGLETPAARLYGTEYAESATGQNGVPDTDFERRMSADYPGVVMSQRTLAQRVVADLDVWGVVKRVPYIRWLFPIQFKTFRCVGVMARMTGPPVPVSYRDPGARCNRQVQRA